MDENRFDNNMGTTGNSGNTTGMGDTATGATGATGGMGSGSMAGGSDALSGSGTSGITSATEGGDALGLSAGIVSVLEKFGVGESQINAVRDTLKNVNIDQQLDRAKEQVTDSLNKARVYAKQNPGAVLAGVAVLAIGAGLLAASVKKDRD